MKEFIRFKRLLPKNILLINSLYLMGASGITAFLGFLFWIIAARLFDARDVGLATTLLSTSSLIALLSMVGFDTVFIRYLPKSKSKNTQINSGTIVVTLASLLITSIFCFIAPVVSPRLAFVDSSPYFIICLLIFNAFAALNTTTNAIFIAYRRAKFVLFINIVFSVIKLILVLIFQSGGPMTLFNIVGIAQVVNVILSFAILSAYFNYRPSFRLNINVIREFGLYSSASYVSSIFNLLPAALLPIIVIDHLGATNAAYFYIGFTIATTLYTVSYALTQSLFAEASNDIANLKRNTLRCIKYASFLVIPMVIVVYFIGPLVLVLFGHDYSLKAAPLLRILTISSVTITAYTIVNVNFKALKNLKALMIVDFIYASSILLFSLGLIPHMGLMGVGFAWLLGTLIASLTGAVIDWKLLRNTGDLEPTKSY